MPAIIFAISSTKDLLHRVKINYKMEHWVLSVIEASVQSPVLLKALGKAPAVAVRNP